VAMMIKLEKSFFMDIFHTRGVSIEQ